MQKFFEINENGFSIRSKIYFKDLAAVKRVIIFGHGFGGHKDNKAAERFAEKILSKYKNAAVITFDWPCHGDDCRNKLHLEECGTYLRLVIEYARKRFETDELYAYATSFGCYLILKYIHENGNPFKKIALRCPAVRMHKTIVSHLMSDDDIEKLAKGKEVLIGFDRKVKISKEFLDELEAADITGYEYFDYADDILIIHGTKDEVVPIDYAREFADNNIIEFIAVDGADHRFMDPKKMDLAIKYILEFFNL